MGKRQIRTPSVARTSATDVVQGVGSTLAMTQRGDYAVIVVSGSIDASALHHLRCHLRATVDAGTTDLVIDISDVDACDNRLAAVLARVQTRLRARHGGLQLMGVPSQLRKPLSVGRLPESFVL